MIRPFNKDEVKLQIPLIKLMKLEDSSHHTTSIGLLQGQNNWNSVELDLNNLTFMPYHKIMDSKRQICCDSQQLHISKGNLKYQQKLQQKQNQLMMQQQQLDSSYSSSSQQQQLLSSDPTLFQQPHQQPFNIKQQYFDHSFQQQQQQQYSMKPRQLSYPSTSTPQSTPNMTSTQSPFYPYQPLSSNNSFSIKLENQELQPMFQPLYLNPNPHTQSLSSNPPTPTPIQNPRKGKKNNSLNELASKSYCQQINIFRKNINKDLSPNTAHVPTNFMNILIPYLIKMYENYFCCKVHRMKLDDPNDKRLKQGNFGSQLRPFSKITVRINNNNGNNNNGNGNCNNSCSSSSSDDDLKIQLSFSNKNVHIFYQDCNCKICGEYQNLRQLKSNQRNVNLYTLRNLWKVTNFRVLSEDFLNYFSYVHIREKNSYRNMVSKLSLFLCLPYIHTSVKSPEKFYKFL